MEYVRCNLCGSDDAEDVCTIDGLNIVRCNACTLVYVNPRPDAREHRELYTRAYFESNDPLAIGYDDYAVMEPSLSPVFNKRLKFMEQFCDTGNLLDVGCAFGVFLRIAKENGWNVKGMEVSEYAAANARDATRVEVRAGELTGVGFDSDEFDVVTMWDVLEHTRDPAATLSEIQRILKGSGYLFFTVPDVGGVLSKLMGRHWFGYKKVKEHNYFFSKKTITKMLEQCEFDVVQIRPSSWPCDVGFLVSKLEHYSAFVHHILKTSVEFLHLSHRTVNFRFIDIMIVARKQVTGSVN